MDICNIHCRCRSIFALLARKRERCAHDWKLNFDGRGYSTILSLFPWQSWSPTFCLAVVRDTGLTAASDNSRIKANLPSNHHRNPNLFFFLNGACKQQTTSFFSTMGCAGSKDDTAAAPAPASSVSSKTRLSVLV